MRLPKPGTKVEDLKCPTCNLALKDVAQPCTVAECPQKPKETDSEG